MLHAQYRWSLTLPDEAAAAKLADEMHISPLLATLLVTRGWETKEAAEQFLNGTLEQLHDPYLLHGMEPAVQRIKQGLSTGEKIMIYGDYDADGISSTSLMILLMRHLGANFDYYIPHRSKEGYGLHNHALEAAAERGFSLIVTVDTGISAVEQIAYAAQLGIDVIVTDHHEPPAVLPEAYTLINPKLSHCSYPFKGLAGVGVAYKLACALLDGDVPHIWTQLAAIGTVADLMPLSGENRILVQEGLRSMSEQPLAGVKALLELSSSSQITSTTIGFSMAPRINASGRMAHAKQAVQLLITEDADEALRLASELDLLNRERQQTVDDIVTEAVEQLENRLAGGSIPPVIVIAGENWNIGVVGIVASKILEKYYRPTIILGIQPETGICKGSARSIPGFDVYEALTECADLLDHYGGHTAAAGMSLSVNHVEAFTQRLIHHASQTLREEDYVPKLTADLECTLEQISLQTVEQLSRLEPFGMDNALPRFLIRDAELVEYKQMGKDKKHLKLVLQQNGNTIEAVAFGKGDLASLLADRAKIDLVAEASINEWNGSRKPQLMVVDLAVNHLQVYDYRGVIQPLKKMEQLKNELEAAGQRVPGRAALVCRELPNVQQFSQLRELPVWVYDRNADLIQETEEQAATEAPESVTTLFVMQPPETPEQLDMLLSFFVHVERIFLLHPQGIQAERVEWPTREHFKKVYVLLREVASGKQVCEAEIMPRLAQHLRISSKMLAMILDVFEELAFIHRVQGHLTINPAPSKRQLDTSRNFQEMTLMAEMEHYLMFAAVPQLMEWLRSRMQGAS
ncbi:single-stranded-DNA-specific exonuclease RecJ [Paenibacillus sp. CAA11]|uniref:single-stranded-DNA-specific exonuclease RecJ n=1 Tax=Paenibacillus sp. CAA11 TaxID=1532905 RepID=UPI000D3503D8|nr:single-stranded-DNA-specific exonuclease RecJ [Paenibacillus sp. CAA11]AWB45692.1 single-stranded-DNA-specific exonuclease RecJ [Paenibacillus sp. CAA11]